MKRQQSKVEPTIDKPRRWKLPSPLELATLAGILRRGEEPASITEALQLWREGCQQWEFEVEVQDARDTAARTYEDIPRPKEFPAKLNDFLGLIVHAAKTPADANKRFRDFLRYRIDRSYAGPSLESAIKEIGRAEVERLKEAEVDARMKKYSDDGLRYEASWLELAQDYDGWWENQRSAKSTASAKKRKKRTKAA